MELFEAAFDELHELVVKQVTTSGQHVSVHYDYPIMSTLDSGFPSFREAGFYEGDTPRNYVGTVRPRGLVALLSGHTQPKHDFPKSAELSAFLSSHDIGKRLGRAPAVSDGALSNWTHWTVDGLVGDAVERYLHLNGLDAPVEAKRRSNVIWPVVVEPSGAVLTYGSSFLSR